MTAPGRRLLRICCCVYLIALAGSWCVAMGALSAKARRLHRSPVELLFFQNTAQSFSDLVDFDASARRMRSDIPVTSSMKRKAETYITVSSYGYGKLVYPAMGMCDYLLFMAFPQPVAAFLIIITGFAAAAAAGLIVVLQRADANRVLMTATVFMSLALAYPLYFLLERGNVEGVIWAVQILALAAFVNRRYWPAAFLVALAAAMKGYPAVFLLLFLHRKRYKEMAFSVASIPALNVIGLWLLGPTISQANADVRSGLEWARESMLLNYRDGYVLGYDHSLFAAVKQALHFTHLHDPAVVQSLIQQAALPYSVCVLAGFAALYWFRVRKLPLLNQILVLTVAEITLPYMSQEYTLLHLYFAWGLLLVYLGREAAAGRAAIPWPAGAAMMAAFGFLFGPTPHQYVSRSLVGQAQLAALLVAAAAAAVWPVRVSEAAEKRPAATAETRA